MLKVWSLSVVRLNFRLRMAWMPFWRSEEDQKTVRGTVFPTNPAHPAQSDAETRFVQLPGHPGAAAAAHAQAVLITDIGEEHHVASLAMRRGPVLPGMEPAL